LFADVRLQKGDDARRPGELGLPLKKKGLHLVFPQPCACFDGQFCRIYDVRPGHCRAFECGLLKRVQAGDMNVDAALRTIAGAQAQAEQVRQWLRRLGDRDETLALIRRYARVMGQPIDLSGRPEAGEERGKLMLAMNDLMRTLQREFLR
jgi:hypothetical protein